MRYIGSVGSLGVNQFSLFNKLLKVKIKDEYTKVNIGVFDSAI